MKIEKIISNNIIRLAFCVSLIFNFQFSIFNCARAQYTVTHLGKPVNTPGSETGALRLDDTVLVFSSMEHSSGKNSQFDVGGPMMQVYQARITRNGNLARPHLDRWGLNSKRDHTGNIAFDPYTQDIYFTRGDVETLNCEIYYAKKKRRRGWEKPVKLKGAVNMEGYTSTHPSVGRLADSTVILYFVSNRPGGLGGADIWYTLVKGGQSGECVNLGPMVNSPADEYTPFYDQRNGVLYFSSDRAGGKGGHDIYGAVGQRNSWQQAEAVCHCLNSEQNDLYFTITSYDSITGRPLAGYLASNRSDSFFLTDTSCCNDLYEWRAESGEQRTEDTVSIAVDTTTVLHSPLSTLHSFTFPLYLYFHNDEPDPMSRKGTTETSYTDCQRRYAQLRGEYVGRQTSAADSALMEEFFDSCVVGNYERVEALFDYIEEQLDEGHSIVLTIAGYASPVFHNDYNQLLSERRIASFINMLRHWRGGMFADAMDDRRLTVEQKPMGVDNNSSLITHHSSFDDPVYGLPAAMARRIEISSCEAR